MLIGLLQIYNVYSQMLGVGGQRDSNDCLIGAGYIHFKRSPGFKSEADIAIESNPHARRNLLNTEAIIAAYLFSNDLMMKMLKDEKLTEEEI